MLEVTDVFTMFCYEFVDETQKEPVKESDIHITITKENGLFILKLI